MAVESGKNDVQKWSAGVEVRFERGEWYYGKPIKLGKLVKLTAKTAFIESEEYDRTLRIPLDAFLHSNFLTAQRKKQMAH